jgi:thiamine pyrophosphate-dependent acetolactate synthase large subunit-like protein
MILRHKRWGVMPMDAHTAAHIAALARAAGLDKALANFPDDVEAAAAQALNNAHAMQIPTDPAAEPWPPMHPGVGL